MSNNNSSSSSGGVGLLGLTFIVFLILKLAEIGQVKDWSWWWVTCPLWIVPAILIAIGLGWIIFKGIDMLVDWIRWKLSKKK